MRWLDDEERALFDIFRRDYPNLKPEETLKLWDYTRILQLRAETDGKKKLSYSKIAKMLGISKRQIFRILKYVNDNYSYET